MLELGYFTAYHLIVRIEINEIVATVTLSWILEINFKFSTGSVKTIEEIVSNTRTIRKIIATFVKIIHLRYFAFEKIIRNFPQECS